MPSDPVDLAYLYTHGWQFDFHDPDSDYDREESTNFDIDYATRKAVEQADVIANDPALIVRTLEKFVLSDGKTVSPFAHRLAELAPSVTNLFESALAIVEGRQEAVNLDFFCGLIAGVDTRDSEAARDCIRLALNSEKLKKYAVSMIGSCTLQLDDIQLVVSLLQSGAITPWQCASLSYGRRKEHLDTKDILPLLRELPQHGTEGLWAVLNIVSMVVHGGRDLTNPLVSNLQNVLVDQRLFDSVERSGMRGHDLERMITFLAQRDLIDQHFARALVKQFLGICAPRMSGVFYELDGPIRSSLKILMKQYPREVWGGISSLLMVNDFLTRHRVEVLVGIERHDDHLGPGFLYAIPAEFYLEWARKDPARRASLVIKWLPVTMKSADGTLVWDPALESFISEFADQEKVLAALSTRLYPRSYYGSVAPHLHPQVKLLESWFTHPRSVVRQWARGRATWIKTQVE